MITGNLCPQDMSRGENVQGCLVVNQNSQNFNFSGCVFDQLCNANDTKQQLKYFFPADSFKVFEELQASARSEGSA